MTTLGSSWDPPGPNGSGFTLRRGPRRENQARENKPRKAVVAAVAPPLAAARGWYRCVQLLPLVPTQLASLILVKCGGRTIKGKF